MDFSHFCHSVITTCLHHAIKVVCVLCMFSVCTMYWLYYNVSGQLGPPLNRHVYIRDSRRWNEMLNGSSDMVWPRTVNETDDRILSQIRFMEHYGTLPANRTMKHILHVGHFNFENVRDGQYEFVSAKCPVQECSITSNESLSDFVDVLLISEMSYFNYLQYLPKPAHQLWIAQHWESAMHDRIHTWLVRRYINWTVSYRRDSTLGISYGKFARVRNDDGNQQTVDYSAGKTKQVAWLVSNCNAKNNRLAYAHELAKYIEVDIYGACGNLQCNRTGPESCHNRLVKHYRFFLAFENSNCKDYITEKLYHAALQHNVIPVVMGARPEDYAALAPPGSYIDARSFTGPEELAQYLKVLASDPKLYNKYFEWKKTWSPIDVKYWCRLCMMLHLADDIGYYTWFDNYQQWWNSVCGTSCLRASGFIALINVVVTFVAVNTWFCHASVES